MQPSRLIDAFDPARVDGMEQSLEGISALKVDPAKMQSELAAFKRDAEHGLGALEIWEDDKQSSAGEISKDFLLSEEQALRMMNEGDIDPDQMQNQQQQNKPLGKGPGMMSL